MAWLQLRNNIHEWFEVSHRDKVRRHHTVSSKHPQNTLALLIFQKTDLQESVKSQRDYKVRYMTAGCRYLSTGGHSPGMCEALCSIPSTTEKQNYRDFNHTLRYARSVIRNRA